MRRGKNILGDLTKRGMLAYNCGWRMYQDGMDYVTATITASIDIRPLLTKDEQEAFDQLMLSTFLAQWWHGWNDAAASDLAQR